MHLSDHSLRQIDDVYLQSLEVEALRGLSVRLLADLKEARDRLNQGPENSSRPPRSRAPWERPDDGRESDADAAAEADAAADDREPGPAEANPAEASPAKTPSARHPGKQPGAPGIGRTQVFRAHEERPHYPGICAGCGRALDPAGAVAYTGLQTVDLRWREPGRPGLTLWVVDHRYYEAPCTCGHRTRATAGQGVVDPLLAGVELGEWRLVGPGLAALIVALALRFRLSRARIQEFLGEWLGLELSIGTIHQTLHEAGAAVAPAEEELVQAVLDSALLHADETSWPEAKQTLWLWVFVAATATLYYVAGRGKERVENVLDGFRGWLMSDGWGSYRHYPRRLRCWAHLIRKARGLAQSCDRPARAFGRLVLDTLEALMAAVYAAREGPPPVDLPTQHAPLLTALRAACERRQQSDHAKTHALAIELLNDWEAIFQVLSHPALPLTNNDAERALRHWVIARQISHGTRTATGSRVFALLASVIDTCRQRGHSPWPYLAAAIADRRAGRPLAPLPLPGG
ncbi:MAG: IS66 family transposase [Candidatus Competibacter sp.]|nr:IS66 family transposase [Candidatus Competibacter sp.]